MSPENAMQDRYDAADAAQRQEVQDDAARYRWLRAQFERRDESRHWDEHVGSNGKGQELYEKRLEFWCAWALKDDWRFGETVSSLDSAKSFDGMVDDLRGAVNGRGSDAQS